MKKCVVAVLGGDKRMDFAACELERAGYEVREWGRCKSDDSAAFLSGAREWLSSVDAIMLPLPASLDGIHLSTPMLSSGNEVRMDSLFSVATDKIWLVGRLGEALRLRAEQEKIRLIDYFDNEILQLKNAIPTAEGAIEIAMRELPVVLDGTKVAVIGYGRIGEVLSAKLKSLGASVTVWARRPEVCVRAEVMGHSSKQIVFEVQNESNLTFDRDTRVIFNTVPSRLLTRNVLERLERDCLIIDLASAPGGVDGESAKEFGIHSIWATALPGKCAPESAGVILGQTVHSVLANVNLRSDF
mgnify:CR=1 FL=1